MELSPTVLDLACEFNDALASGASPRIEYFLGRTANEQERVDLLIQLLVSESGYGPFDPERLTHRMHEFSELRGQDDRVIEVLRLIFDDRALARENLAWEAFRPFGFSPERLLLRVGSEQNYLGEQIAGRYELEQRVGAGTFGVVFTACDLLDRKHVAIKAAHYPKKPELAVGMIRHEADIGQRLKHPNIVQVHEFLLDARGNPYLAMDFIAAGSLVRLTKAAPIEAVRAAQIILQVAEALAFAHQEAVFHRDVKPQNILLDRDDKAYVSDFGFALAMDEQWNKQGEIAGTFAYMAPELLIGQTHKIDGRSDIWSVGVIFYELLSSIGFAGYTTREDVHTAAVLAGRGEGELPFPAGVHAAFRRICSRCIQSDPVRRFDTADELVRVLRDAIAEATGHPAVIPQRQSEHAGCLVSAWRMGMKLGEALVHQQRLIPKIQAIQQLRLLAKEALVEVARVSSTYASCRVASSQLGFDLPAFAADHQMRFLQALHRPAPSVQLLPDLAQGCQRVLDEALEVTRVQITKLGPEPCGVFDLAYLAASYLPGTSAVPYLEAARASALPESLWMPLVRAMEQNEDEATVRRQINQLDKRVERHLLRTTPADRVGS